MKLLSNHILVEPLPQKQVGLIVMPPIAYDDHNTGGPKVHSVLAVGPGRRNRKGVLLPIECEAGDRVICESYTTGAHELENGRKIITDDMILAVLPGGIV